MMDDMVDVIATQLDGHAEALHAQGWQIERPAPFTWVLTPPGTTLRLPAGRRTGLVLVAAAHGNEVAGLGVLDGVLRDLRDGMLRIRFPLGLVIGNPEAARHRLRYLDRDLNRSYGRDTTDSREDRRARELEPLLSTATYMMDVHQTSDTSATPFFIFPYDEAGIAFARAIQPDWPVVTFCDPQYSPMGRCCDEYVRLQGGTGITLELGQAGVDPYQVAVGRWAAARAVFAVETALQNLAWPTPESPAPVYTWSDMVEYPAEPSDFLPHVQNFSDIQRGQVLGEVGGRPFAAPRDGKILFPMRPAHLAHLPQRPRALYRVLVEVDLKEWPPEPKSPPPDVSKQPQGAPPQK